MKMKISVNPILYAAFILICVFSGQTVWANQPQKVVYVIPVNGTVEPGLSAYIKRNLEKIRDEADALIVFELDTFGGRVDAALDIVDVISNIPSGTTIAYVDKRAISAGALIALASSRLYMKNNTLIGDCAPIIQTQDGQQMAGEKIQTVLRARFRALAKKNNYPQVLAESMVTIDMEVYEVVMDGKKMFIDKQTYDDLTPQELETITAKKTVVAKGELLTMDDQEAFELGFSSKSVENIDQVLSDLGYGDAQIIRIEASWSERLVRFLQPMLPVLMLLGIGALYTEIKAPGFGLPGMVGILCLALVFFNQYLVGLADYTELMLLMIGVLLLGIEVFVLPGFGVAGISGLIVIGAGLVLSFQGFVVPDPQLPWEGALLMRNIARVSAVFISSFLISLFMIRFVLPRLSTVVSGPYLSATLKNSHADVTQNQGLKVNDQGVAHSFLRPSGKVMIHDRKIDAITQGEFIESGTPVVVVRIDQNRVIVKPVPQKTEG